MEKYLQGVKGEVSHEMMRCVERGSSTCEIQKADPVELLRSLRNCVNSNDSSVQLLNRVDEFLQGESRELQVNS